jgi:hypothetical protein
MLRPGAAVINTAKTVVTIDRWLRRNGPDWLRHTSPLAVAVELDNALFNLVGLDPTAIDAAADDLLDTLDPRNYIPAPTTGMGKFLETTAQLATGALLPAGFATRVLQLGKLPAAIAADFGSGFLALDPRDESLSGLVDRVAPGFVDDFIKSRPEDEQELLRRLENGLVNAGLGAAFSGIVKTLGVVKSAIGRVRSPAGDAVTTPEAAASKANLAPMPASTAETPGEAAGRPDAVVAPPPPSLESTSSTTDLVPRPTSGEVVAGAQQGVGQPLPDGVSLPPVPVAEPISPALQSVPTGPELIAKARAEGGYVPTPDEADAMSAQLADIQQRQAEREVVGQVDGPEKPEVRNESQPIATDDRPDQPVEAPSEEAKPTEESGDPTSETEGADQRPWSAKEPFEYGPGFRTEVRDRYTFTIDELNRTRRAQGELILKKNVRDTRAQRRAGGEDRLPTDHGGHLSGQRFDGPPDDINLIAQDGKLNMGEYKKLENEWAAALKAGKSVHVDIRPHYSGASLRPDSLEVHFMIDGKADVRRFENRPGG